MNVKDKIQRIPLILCGKGPSVNVLKNNIDLFKESGVFWGAVNNMYSIEDEVLSLINKKLDILYFSSLDMSLADREEILNFIARGEGLFITNHEVAGWMGLSHGGNVYLSSFGYGFNSLFAFLVSYGKVGGKKVCLIGFDGGENYYSDEIYFSSRFTLPTREYIATLKNDADVFNRVFPIIYKNYDLRTEVVTLVGSRINCFPQMTIEQIAKEVK
jgi:hypothetical protein